MANYELNTNVSDTGTVTTDVDETFVYSDPWEDDWSNDYELDALVIPRTATEKKPDGYENGACNHQNSASGPVVGKKTQNEDPCK